MFLWQFALRVRRCGKREQNDRWSRSSARPPTSFRLMCLWDGPKSTRLEDCENSALLLPSNWSHWAGSMLLGKTPSRPGSTFGFTPVNILGVYIRLSHLDFFCISESLNSLKQGATRRALKDGVLQSTDEPDRSCRRETASECCCYGQKSTDREHQLMIVTASGFSQSGIFFNIDRLQKNLNLSMTCFSAAASVLSVSTLSCSL